MTEPHWLDMDRNTFIDMTLTGHTLPIGIILLTDEEKSDVRSGKCVYREWEGTPILDYGANSIPKRESKHKPPPGFVYADFKRDQAEFLRPDGWVEIVPEPRPGK